MLLNWLPRNELEQPDRLAPTTARSELSMEREDFETKLEGVARLAPGWAQRSRRAPFPS